MGIGKFFRKVGTAVAHPKETAERVARRRMIAMVIAAVLGLAASAGYNFSPAFQDAVVDAVNAVWTVVEEAPQPVEPEAIDIPVEPVEDQ